MGAKYSTLLGSYFIDCEANGPDVIFSINGFDFHVQAKDYVLSVRIFFKIITVLLILHVILAIIW